MAIQWNVYNIMDQNISYKDFYYNIYALDPSVSKYVEVLGKRFHCRSCFFRGTSISFKVAPCVIAGVLKPGFHLCLKGAWDMSKVPVTHVSTCVLSQGQ